MEINEKRPAELQAFNIVYNEYNQDSLVQHHRRDDPCHQFWIVYVDFVLIILTNIGDSQDKRNFFFEA
jgi:hypothetical protein